MFELVHLVTSMDDFVQPQDVENKARAETQIKRQATQHDCLPVPSLLGGTNEFKYCMAKKKYFELG